jgi:hypothetical protein
MLARKIDSRWQEVAPLELRFTARASRARPFFIQKRNYLGKEAAYAVDYFRHSARNLNVADINNHITSEYVGVTTGGRGMAIAMNTDVSANFAFCPFKTAYLPATGAFRIRANPFGTYHGEQIVPPTSGNRLGYEAVLLSAPQFHSAGPTYNGHQERFEVMLAFFDGDAIPVRLKEDLIAFARPPMVLGARRPADALVAPPDPLPPAGFVALAYRNGVLFHWERAGADETLYRIRCRTGHGEKRGASFCAKGTTLYVDSRHIAAGVTPGGSHTATIEALYPDGRRSAPSPAIRFRLETAAQVQPDIPARFKARMVWANLSAWIQRHLL